MKTYKLTDAKARFSEVVEEAARGEEIIVTKLGKPVAKVVPYKPQKAAGRLGVMRGEFEIPDDFDEWPEEEARALGIID